MGWFLGRKTKKNEIEEFLSSRVYGFKLFDEAIEGVEKELADLNTSSEVRRMKLMEEIPKFNEDQIDEISDEEWKVIDQLVDFEMDYSINYGYLESLAEMKIGFCYKQFEVALKELTLLAYNVVNPKSLFKWDTIRGEYNAKGIIFSERDGYVEIEQLRSVNNAIKHGGEVSKIQFNPPEFVGKDDLEYRDLVAFYERVNAMPVEFLKSLIQAILADLYTFDEDRIAIISEEYKERMDAETLEAFREALR